MTETIARVKAKIAATYDADNIDFWKKRESHDDRKGADDVLVEKYREVLSQRLKTLERMHEPE